MLPRRLALLVASAALLGGPATATAATRSDARSFTTATLAFDLSRGNAVGRAERLGDARRTAATACLETVRASPARRRDELYSLYFTYVSAGYFAEDEPIFARWVRALKRIPTRNASLRAARTTLTRELATARTVYAQGRGFCAPVERWASSGWVTDARPTVVRRLRELGSAPRAARAGIPAAARVLTSSGGSGGALAADVLRDGIDEPDETVIKGDDPFVALLAPNR